MRTLIMWSLSILIVPEVVSPSRKESKHRPNYQTLPSYKEPFPEAVLTGLFFGFAFGVAGIASAVLGNMADKFGIEAVYNVCAYMPLLGLVTWFLPDLKKNRK